MPTPSTREELYEYRVVNIVRRILKEFSIRNAEPKTGDDLQRFLAKYSDDLGVALMDDIEVWMGWDDLLKQVQNG